MWINVGIEESKLCMAQINCGSHGQAWSPWTFMPWQINTSNFAYRQLTQQRDAGVTTVVQIDWLFEIQPPLSRRRFDSAGNSRRNVHPAHVQCISEFVGHVMPA